MSFGGGKGGDGGAALQQQEEARKDALRARVNALFQGPDSEPQFKQQEDTLSQNLRDYYSTDLKRNYDQTERALRFKAADTGNIGGSVAADQQSLLDQDNQMGGTRIEEAVRRAVNNLRNTREDTRQRSISMINAGEGESGVQSASQGLQQAIASANAAQKENIFGDLFSNLATAKVTSDNEAKNAGLLAAFRQMNTTLRPTAATNSGTIYNTG
jgi:hypothetical protein